MDRLSKEQRRKNMQAVKSSGSKIETALAKALYAKGYRYRRNNSKVFGRPDITFSKQRLAIFVDSEFWHGKNWEAKKNDFKSNIEFWQQKIERNIQRDKLVNRTLRKQGWKVLRFWGKSIETKLLSCVLKTERELSNKELE